MDSQPPDSAFPAAFSAHTSRITRVRSPLELDRALRFETPRKRDANVAISWEI